MDRAVRRVIVDSHLPGQAAAALEVGQVALEPRFSDWPDVLSGPGNVSGQRQLY